MKVTRSVTGAASERSLQSHVCGSGEGCAGAETSAKERGPDPGATPVHNLYASSPDTSDQIQIGMHDIQVQNGYYRTA